MSAFPVRFSVMTYNIWGSNLWPQRSSALTQMLSNCRADIILFQECTPELLQFLDTLLSEYDRIKDDTRIGWSTEGNIYWKKACFKLTEHGAGDLGIDDHPNRALFWARLEFMHDSSKKLFVSTLHMPWSGCDKEIETGINQRIPCSLKACEILRSIHKIDEPLILGGDFNDDFHPIRVLNDEMGLQDVFESLDQPPPVTHPVRPSSSREEQRPNRTLDWITTALPVNMKVVAAYTKQTRGGVTGGAASDHFPVIAFIEMI